MGTAQSKTPSSSLDVGTASIVERSSSSSSIANEQTASSSTQLSATKSTDDISLTQHNTQPYNNPPSSKTPILTHYIFLVHGWLGNDLEMAYLSTAFKSVLNPNSSTMDGSNTNGDTNDDVAGTPPDQKRVRRSSSYLTHITSQQHQQQQVASTIQPEVVVHSVKCNVGKTTDGIINGGKRLANEIVNFIKNDVENRLLDNASSSSSNGEEDQQHHVTYSIVGNSLGGLYSRYAISLLPYQLPLNINSDGIVKASNTQKGKLSMLNIHPNIFCTTATPHLGVSRHTYLPIPRIAETIIGTGMGKTGEDLFRLNSDKMNVDGGLKNGGLMEHVGRGVRRLSALRSSNNLKDDAEDEEEDINNGIINFSDEIEQDEEEMECIIHNMCTSEKYLSPLRNFRQRIAYANVYGTDFQVPTLTAAFLNEKSGVGHFVVGSRDLNSSSGATTGDESIEEKKEEDVSDGDEVAVGAHKRELSEHGEDATTDKKNDTFPPFIVAVVRTEKQTQPQSPTKAHYIDDATADDELLQMSQSLDALGWTKVFIDVRDRIPVPGLAKPAWLKGPYGSLDDLIRERKGLKFDSLHQSHTNIALSTETGAVTVDNASEESSEANPKVQVDDTANKDEQCILTSQELAASTNSGDSFHFPLGHTVMVANSKSEQYSKLNSQGRPVMDRLAENMVESVLEFE